MARLVAFEGIDGSGKGTQAALLLEALLHAGRTATLISFPQYQATRFGQQVGRFLNGQFGTLDQVHPVLVSLLFAGDRLESRPLLVEALSRSEIVICDRYVPSNIAHQTAKACVADQADVHAWIEFVEYELYQLPRPDLVFWLDMPVPQAQKLIARKQRRDYTDRVADLQEADAAYLARVREVYARLAEQDSRWQAIRCCVNDEVRASASIAAEIAEHVAGMKF